MIAVLLMILWVELVLTVMSLMGLWKMFGKASQPRWGAIVPIYSTYLTIKIARRPVHWLLLLLVPLVNIVVIVKLSHSLSRQFGHGTGYTLGLVFLAPIFLWILGFGSSAYSPVDATHSPQRNRLSPTGYPQQVQHPRPQGSMRAQQASAIRRPGNPSGPQAPPSLAGH